MVMTCPSQHRPCFAIECCGAGECFLEQCERERKPMVYSMQCKAHQGLTCYLESCLVSGKCTSYSGSVDEAVDRAFSTGTKERKVSEHAAQFTCPTDKNPCYMLSCNGGQTCYVANKSKGQSSVHVTKAAPPCHEGMHTLGWLNKAELLIGKENAAKGWDQEEHGKIGLIIGLLGDAYPQGAPVNMNEPAKGLGSGSLNVLLPVIPNIWIRWPDYGVVPFKRPWWDNLILVIASVEGAVLLYCMGGHGRSGTAAAIICALTGLCPEGEDPVAWLREKYCSNAVESDSQIKYIELITGRKVTAAIAKHHSYNVWNGYGSYPQHGSALTSEEAPVKKKGGGNGKKPKPASDPNVLSKRKWKAWWRKQSRTGVYEAIATVSRPIDIPDGFIFAVGKNDFRWCAKDDCFRKEA